MIPVERSQHVVDIVRVGGADAMDFDAWRRVVGMFLVHLCHGLFQLGVVLGFGRNDDAAIVVVYRHFGLGSQGF